MAARPLRLEELAEILAFDFDEAPGGIPALKADWRREDQERAVLSTCSSLITIVHNGHSRVVQFSHFSVKEFLTSDRLALAAEDISFYHIAPTPAHTILVQACLGVLLRLEDGTLQASAQQFPLVEYAFQHWVDHALFENVSLRIKDGIEDLFDEEKPHFMRWIWARRNMDDTFLWREDFPPQKSTPMYYAAFCGFSDVLEKLIREHPDHVNTTGGILGTPLHAASRMNHLKVAQSLLRHGADVNALGLRGRTPLVFASEWRCLEVVRWLLENGADVNAKDKNDGWTSLHSAAFAGHLEVVRTLLKHNANTNARDNDRRTPLHLACDHDDVDIVRLLLNNGADPMARTRNKATPLHTVSASGSLDIARLLLERGADLDAEDEWRQTACQIAFHLRRDELCKILLSARVWSKAGRRISSPRRSALLVAVGTMILVGVWDVVM